MGSLNWATPLFKLVLDDEHNFLLGGLEMTFNTDRGRYIVTILMALCFVLGTFMTAFAAEFPPKPTNDIYVVDQAGVIKEDAKKQILALGRDLNAKTKAQVVVVTVKSFDGLDPAEYANQLFRSWGIGDRKQNNGILFLVAVNDRKMRLEIGSGLEGRIPDMTAGRILDDYAKPYFAKGDYNSGVLNTYKVLISETAAEYGAEGMAGDTAAVKGPEKKQSTGTSLLALFLALVFWQQLLIIIIVLVILWLCINCGIFPFFGGGGGGGGFFDSFGGGSSGGGGSDSDW